MKEHLVRLGNHSFPVEYSSPMVNPAWASPAFSSQFFSRPSAHIMNLHGNLLHYRERIIEQTEAHFQVVLQQARATLKSGVEVRIPVDLGVAAEN